MRHDSPLSLPGWALVLGASSGFGAAASVALARAGCSIVGVHLDRRSTAPNALHVADAVRQAGRLAWFHNVNAADEAKRDRVLDDVARRWTQEPGAPKFRVVLHSLAFGSLLPLVHEDPDRQTSSQQMAMTTSVMASSLVSWVQALAGRGMLHDQARVFAMTSAGASQVWPAYGAVSAAKAALESYVRQLACELAPRGVTVNAICAGVCDTPALRKISSHDDMIAVALRKNPHRRLTRPEDVASAIVALARPETYWMTGNVIAVDGGEGAAG